LLPCNGARNVHSLHVYQEQGGPEYLVIDRRRRAEVQTALDAGWKLDCVSLVGPVAVAIGALERLEQPNTLDGLGLSWKRLADEADAPRRLETAGRDFCRRLGHNRRVSGTVSEALW